MCPTPFRSSKQRVLPGCFKKAKSKHTGSTKTTIFAACNQPWEKFITQENIYLASFM